MKVKTILLAMLLLASPLAADDQPEGGGEKEAGRQRTAIAAWVDQEGKADHGAEYTLLEFESPVRKGRMWRVSLLVGTATGGAGVSTEVATQEIDDREARISVGLGAVSRFSELQQGAWRPILFATVRF